MMTVIICWQTEGIRGPGVGGGAEGGKGEEAEEERRLEKRSNKGGEGR